MGYASYLEDINERLVELGRVTELTRRGPAKGVDLSVSVEDKLREIYKQLASLISAFQKKLDDPDYSAKVSAKGLSEALAVALTQSSSFAETNNALRRQMQSTRKHAAICEQAVADGRRNISGLYAANTKLRRANREARAIIGRFQRTIKDLDAKHSRTLEQHRLEKAALQREIQELQKTNQELQVQQFHLAMTDVKPIIRRHS